MFEGDLPAKQKRVLGNDDQVEDLDEVLLGLLAHSLFDKDNGHYWLALSAKTEGLQEEVLSLCRLGCDVNFSLSNKTISLVAVLRTQWQFMTHQFSDECEKNREAESRAKAQKRWSAFRKQKLDRQIEYFKVVESVHPSDEIILAVKESANSLKLMLIKSGLKKWAEQLERIEDDLTSRVANVK